MKKINLIQLYYGLKKISVKGNDNLFKVKNLDSFGFIEFLVFIQEEFKIKIQHEKIFNMKAVSINDLVKILNKSENRKTKKKDYKFFCKYLEKFYSKKHIF